MTALCRCISLLLSLVSWVGLAAADEVDPVINEVTDFGANPGNLRLYIHKPTTFHSGAPLVVVAHGCLQSAAQVATNSGWLELADRYGFALLFPETNKENEPFAGCFRTWLPEHQVRDGGEPLSIRNQVGWAVEHLQVDPERIYMTGQSSGGLVTAVMLASYPELFAAGAVASAYPYRCANRFEDLGPCSQAQKSLADAEWGTLVRNAAPDYAGRRPRIAMWHGGADVVIVPANLELQLRQWANVLDVNTETPAVDTVSGQQRKRYAGPDGAIAIETVRVENMGHAVAVDPNGDPACGKLAPYFVDADICAAYGIGRWFDVLPAADGSGS